MSHEVQFSHRLSLVDQAINDHGGYLRAYLFTLAGREDGEELFDDLWLFVLDRFPEKKISHLGILRRKAYQLYVDHWRKKQRRQQREVTMETLPEVAVPPMTSEMFDFTEESDAACKEGFFSEYREVELTDDQKTALWLSARHGFTHKEVGVKMGKAPSTVGDWITQSKKAFADALNRT